MRDYIVLFSLLYVMVASPSLLAQPGPDSYGVHAGELLTGLSAERVGAIARQLDSAGVRWVRFQIPWSAVEPSQGEWHWFDFASKLDSLAAHGISPLAILRSTPRWASTAPPEVGDDTAALYEPRDTVEWMTYVDSTVRRFAGRIKHWEIWNEPDGFYFLVNVQRGKPARYARILRSGYATIKRADPGAMVLFGGITSELPRTTRRAFLDSIFAHGAASAFDIMNVHCYRYEDDPVRYARQVMERYGNPAPIWVTETNNWRPLEPVNSSQATADSLARWLDWLWSTGPSKVFWFNFRDFAARGEDSVVWGLFDRATFAPTPVYAAYRAYILRTSAAPSGTDGASAAAIGAVSSSGGLVLRIDLQRAADVRVELFDHLGRCLMRHEPGILPAGRHELSLHDGGGTGLRMVRLIAGGATETASVVIVR